MSGWPSGLRRQTQGWVPVINSWSREFWSTDVGVGSNPTSDTFFCSLLILIQNDKRTVRQRGIEPRSTAWKATMLTITPLTPLAFIGHKTRTNVIQILLTKAHHLSVLSFTVVMYCHFKSFAYWCNGKNILMTTKFYWHRSKCLLK